MIYNVSLSVDLNYKCKGLNNTITISHLIKNYPKKFKIMNEKPRLDNFWDQYFTVHYPISP